MKPAANLSARLIVRKGLATPSHLTRQFARNELSALAESKSVQPNGFKAPPVIDTLDEDYYKTGHDAPAQEPIPMPSPVPAVPLLELRTTDPDQRPAPREAASPLTAKAPLAIVARRLTQKTPKEEQVLKEQPRTNQPQGNVVVSVANRARKPVGCGARIAMTVRLDHDQHHELHAFADSRGRSCQEVFVSALETYMAIYR